MTIRNVLLKHRRATAISNSVMAVSSLHLPLSVAPVLGRIASIQPCNETKYLLDRNPSCSYRVMTRRNMSSVSCLESSRIINDDDGPFGDLFLTQTELGTALVGQTGCIHRTFGPRDNSDTILATGGEALAAHASFDPDYKRAQGWIRQHAVGPAVLSPILLQGLIGSLSEAAFPEGVLVSQSMTQLKPLIVGVAVKARIEVIDVKHSTNGMNQEKGEKNGYMITLRTDVSRARDDELIVEGTKLIWIPDYGNM